MADWTIFAQLQDILITYYFGSQIIFSVALMGILLMAFIASGAPIRYAALFMLPMIAGLSIGGWFGLSGWILNAFLIIIGLLYGFVIINYFSR